MFAPGVGEIVRRHDHPPRMRRCESRARIVVRQLGRVYGGGDVRQLVRTPEEPETVAAGTARVIGVETDRIVAEVSRILDDEQAYQSMRKQNNMYGDGNASARILQGLMSYST